MITFLQSIAMCILSIEPSRRVFSVAATDNVGDIYINYGSNANTHMESSVVMIEEMLSNLGLWYSDINLIIVVTGPGSLTGIRAAIAAVKGIRAVTGVNTVSINAFELCAYELMFKKGIIADKHSHIQIVLKGHGEQTLYLQDFGISKALPVLSDMKIIRKEDFIKREDIAYGGDVLESPMSLNAKVAIEAFLARRSFAGRESDCDAGLEPIYIYTPNYQ